MTRLGRLAWRLSHWLTHPALLLVFALAALVAVAFSRPGLP